MTISERITAMDLWLLDKVFQPLADRLPERPSAIDVGMSLQFGALMLSAASIIAIIMMVHMAFTGIIYNILVWALGIAFFLGLHRMRPLIRTGHANPLRLMLLGIRPISIPFVLFAAWQGSVVPSSLMIATWFNTLSNLVFVIGLYFISCQPNPPQQRQTVKSGFTKAAAEHG